MSRLSLLAVIVLLSSSGYALPEVTDDLGEPVRLSQPAGRIVTLSPHAAELVLAAGAQAKLVGVAEFSPYPQILNSLPRVAAYSGADRELLLAMKPDLVIAWASGGKPDDIRWLKSQGIAVFQSEPSQLSQIADTIEKIGALAGTEQTATQAAAQFRQQLADICPERLGKPMVKAYYEIWPQPPMTIGGKHWLNEALALVGLSNTFADQDRTIFTLEPEALRTADAKISILAIPDDGRWLPGRKVLGNSELGRPGPGLLQGIRKLCLAVHGL